jgi:hypothetical protein
MSAVSTTITAPAIEGHSRRPHTDGPNSQRLSLAMVGVTGG